MALTIPGQGGPLIMGVLNVTPDSFSDGGRFMGTCAAVDQALSMVRQGAAIIDVGGESTRPGAGRVDADEQQRRVLPVIAQVRAALDKQGPAGQGILISIDTTRADVAQAALDAGAAMINDVSAGREDARMLPLAGQRDVAIVLMHMQGQPATMQQQPTYDDVVTQVRTFLLERADAAQAAGVTKSRIILDPGIGFGKTTQHNLMLLAHLDKFEATGYPILVGASRKGFIAQLSPQSALEATDRLGGTCAVTALAAMAGVAVLRVHDVEVNLQAAKVAGAIRSAGVDEKK